MIGLDIEILPFKNVGFQSSFLIDDFDFSLIGKDAPASKLITDLGGSSVFFMLILLGLQI